ncbi:hypothetical protein [Ottowia thiooxydans]|uniref:hypothetical protein n=1 Tax=Ottowia thiooxydans TaxID=219182 RepID=UPI0004272DD8|nr:hypothetical protein [Ottowia thiooxydans]
MPPVTAKNHTLGVAWAGRTNARRSSIYTCASRLEWAVSGGPFGHAGFTDTF